MKKLNKNNKQQIENSKIGILKNVVILLGILVFCLWLVWFTFDCIFVSHGLPAIFDSLVDPWDMHWYNITKITASVLLGLGGGYIALLVAYMVNCGLQIKQNIQRNIYLLICIAATFIALTICIVKAAEMMINDKFVLSVVNLELYHLDYLKWMSIIPAVVMFSVIILAGSFRGFSYKTITRDINIVLMSLACAVLALTPSFIWSVLWHNNYAWIDDTWIHVVCQCITSPMGTFAGTIMVLMVIRIIITIFAYNNRWKEKKSHMIIFSILTAAVFIAFIVAHVNKMDFQKLIFDYDSMQIGCAAVVSAQSFTCLAAGVYCALSHKNYIKKVD